MSTTLPSSNETAQPSDGPIMKTFTDEVKSFFLGDDIFISYARADSTGYALALANRLGRKKFICYLDQYGTGINDELDERVIRKLKRSRVLVLIGSRSAINSGAIRQEIELFKKTERAIIPIDVDGAFRDTQLYKVIRGLPLAGDPQPTASLNSPTMAAHEVRDSLLETEINLPNDNPSSEVVDGIVSRIDALSKPDPSQRVIDRIKSTLSYTKRTQLQRRMLWFGVTFLLVSLSLAIVLLYVANAARTAAREALDARDTAVNTAAQARGETERANEQAIAARGNATIAALNEIAANMDQAIADLKRKDAEEREQQAFLNAQQQERVARSLAQVTEAARLETERPSDALVISADAYGSAPDAIATHTGLLRSLQRYRHLESIVPIQSSALTSISSALNGRVIASVKNNRDNVTLNLYDTKTKRRFEAKGAARQFELDRIVCIPTGSWCAASTVALNGTTILVWRLRVRADDIIAEPLDQRFEFSPFFNEKNSFALTTDERLVAYQFNQSKVLVWELAKPNDPPKKIDLTGYSSSCLTVSPNNRTLALGVGGGVLLRDLDDPTFTRQIAFPEGTGAIKNLTFTPNGRFLAAGNANGSAVIIEVATHKVLGGTLRDAGPEVSFVPQKFVTLLVTANEGGRITTWEISEPLGGLSVRQGKSHDYQPGAFSVTTLHDQNSTLAIGGGDGALALWDMSGQPLLDSINHSQTRDNDHLLFDKSGKILLIDSDDGHKDFLDFSSNNLAEISNPSTHNGVKSAYFSPWVFAESELGVFLVDPMKPDAKPEEIPIDGDGVEAAAINTDASMLAVVKEKRDKTGTKDTVHGVVLWDFRNRTKPKQLRTLAYREDATCVAFSRDKRLVAVGYNSGRIIVWNVSTGKIVRELASLLTMVTHALNTNPSVISLAFNSDGKAVAASSLSSPLTLWDTASGALIGSLEENSLPRDHAYSMVFTLTGKKLITSTPGGIKVWDTDPSSWAKRALKVANR